MFYNSAKKHQLLQFKIIYLCIFASVKPITLLMNPTKDIILIVDDNPMNVLLTDTILKGDGYKTLTANNGMEALTLLNDSERIEFPSLILLDVMMPDKDGLSVCREIKKNPKLIEIPVIFLTANNQTEDLVNGFKAGGVDYITKPFKKEELLVRVKNHLELFYSKRTILDMNKTKSKLYSIIAHDIRSPLSGIQQTIDAIDQGYFDPCSEDFKELIHQLGIRTRETTILLNSLLSWTKVESDAQRIELKYVDINNIFSSCLLLLGASAQEKKIGFIQEITDNTIAYCDEVSAHSIIRNVISNAIKFTGAGGNVTLKTEIVNDSVVISISDNGIGMTEDKLEKIMKADTLVSTAGTNNELGSGLGLVIVRDFVKKNNGKFNIASEPGKGTTVTIVLPKEKPN